jgi:hypothetical protein
MTAHEYMLRLPDGKLLFGYYDTDALARATIAPYADALAGAWRSLNPLRSDSPLLATLNAPLHRSAHRAGTADIDHRVALLLDFDAACASDVMSTAAEHEATISQAGECAQWLGWPATKIDSGRGCQLHVAVDLPADSSTDALIRTLLLSLKLRYPLLDAGMWDRPRLARQPGFWNRKSASPTPERPHRMAITIDGGDAETIVTRAQIDAVISKIGLPAIRSYGGIEKPDPAAVDRTIAQLAAWLDKLNISLLSIDTLRDGRTLLRLSRCPMSHDHRGSSAGIGISVAGQPQNFCRHTGCGMPWSAWLRAVESKTGVQLGRKLVFKNGVE